MKTHGSRLSSMPMEHATAYSNSVGSARPARRELGDGRTAADCGGLEHHGNLADLPRAPKLLKKAVLSAVVLHAVESFLQKSSKGEGCHLWQWARTNRGYGHATFAGRQWSAHRLAFEIHVGPVATGLFVCHRCDTPRCVNPAHLFAGTPLENSEDCSKKGRAATGDKNGSHTKPDRVVRGERVNTARLTAEKVVDVRRLALAGHTYTAIAKIYGVSRVAISKVARGINWAHIATGVAP